MFVQRFVDRLMTSYLDAVSPPYDLTRRDDFICVHASIHLYI